MNVGFFITVRTGSSRLPRKALKEVNGRPIISYLISRFKEQLKNEAPIIICTTTLKEDYILDNLAKEYGIGIYHGDPENIIRRHYECSMALNIDFIINIDGDDILCDPDYAVQIMNSAKKNSSYDIVKSTGLPFGMNSMGYKRQVLERVLSDYDSKKLDTGWGQMINNKELFNILEIPAKLEDTLNVRLSLDYEEDFQLFKNIIEDLFIENKYVSHEIIIKHLKKNPELIKINEHLNEIYWQNYNTKKSEEGR